MTAPMQFALSAAALALTPVSLREATHETTRLSTAATEGRNNHDQ